MDNNKKQTIYTSLSLIGLALLVVGATYAYFQSQVGEGKSTDIEITTATTDLLTFEVGDPLSFEVTKDNFTSTSGSITGETFAQANLLANNSTNTATKTYNLYVLINTNELIYSTNFKNPELLLQVEDPNGNVINSIDGLTYTTVTDGSGASISGFDITTKKGLFNIISDYEINSTSSSSAVSQKWIIKTVFVNYNESQNTNTAKKFRGKVIIQEKAMDTPEIANLCTNGESLSSCIINRSVYEDDIYFHNGTIKDTDGNVIDANDNSYRFAGANPSNYVCFGSDDRICPNDNLYRIIGVFDGRVKLIKADVALSSLLGTDGDYIGAYSKDIPNYKGKVSKADIPGYRWNYNSLTDHTGNNQYGSNTWSTSLLNKTNLNTNFLNNIGNKWAEMIETTIWKVGGNTYEKILSSIPSVTYKNEIINPVTTNTTDNATEYSAKVGLMYVSDYGFAAAPSVWTVMIKNYYQTSVSSLNWLYLGIYEYGITRRSENNYYIANFLASGNLSANFIISNTYAIRPVFYLLSSVNYVSGTGTSSDPIRIS